MQRLLACINFTLGSKNLFCCDKGNMWFLWTMTAVQAAENYGDEWSLTWYICWEIFNQFQPEPTHEIH